MEHFRNIQFLSLKGIFDWKVGTIQYKTTAMCGKLIACLVTIATIAGLSIAQVEHLWGLNETFNAACPPGEKFATVSFPAHMCDPRGYIMCSNGRAIAVSKCGITERFNNLTSWCDVATNVSMPPGCAYNHTVNTYPVTCNDMGASRVAVRSTCKKYVWCLHGGLNHTMDCPVMSFFIKEYERCMYITEPYLLEIPPVSLIECQAKDPYHFNITRT